MTRQDRISFARDLILRDPSISKRGLQVRVKARYSVGLSDTMRRTIIQQANTPNVLHSRVNSDAFAKVERRMLNQAIRRMGNPAYLIKAINERFVRAKDAKDTGITRREFLRNERSDAKESGNIATKTTRTVDSPAGTVKGQVDWWKVLRKYRQEEIDSGDYTPLPKKKPTTKKSDIKKQKDGQDAKQERREALRRAESERVKIMSNLGKIQERLIHAQGQSRVRLQSEYDNLYQMLQNRENVIRRLTGLN